MARAGDVIENPVTGERITFVRTREDTGGSLLEIELELGPASFLPTAHVHTRQQERFTVMSGELQVRLGREERVLTAGASATVPPGTAHAWAPRGDDGARVSIEITPAGASELFFETFFAMGRDGLLDEKGIANPMRMGQLARAYDIYLGGPPVVLQRPVMAALAGVGRLLGYPSPPT